VCCVCWFLLISCDLFLVETMTDEKHNPEDATDLPDYEEGDQDAMAEVTPAMQKDTHVAMSSMGWKDFMLNPLLFRAISDCGFEHPSEVQHAVIPQAIVGTDIICQAKSGMGKTAVFVISVIQQNPEPKNLETVVLAHTRELAMQISKEFKRFVKYLPAIKVATIYGGVPIEGQIQMLRSDAPHIVCGTPGRMMDLIKRGAMDLSHVKYFVVDECDKILCEVRIRQQMLEVFKATPRKKQVMMFSATLSPEMRELCKKHMQNPSEFYIDEDKLTLDGLRQYYFPIIEKDKNRKLIDILDGLEFNQCIIFVSSISRAQTLDKLLRGINFPSICIHGGMDTTERIAHFNEFKEGKSRVLVSTDLMGRGIDVEFVNVVVNYDMTDESDQYLHRVGRAGRFGTKGLAVSFICTQQDKDVLDAVQKRFSVKIPELPDISDIDPNWYRGA